MFMAQAYGVELTITQVVLLGVMMLTLKGAAGVTGSGYVSLLATLNEIYCETIGSMTLLFTIFVCYA
ncbi:cation:dicarboxylase symporter family transporter [Paenibacillus amylolyticus]|nr:cation:dicarboxylase symporter family transporter [Paenibacillus amylolyticus]